MTQSVTLAIGEALIRQHDGLFSLNDLHRASGGESRHQPALFMRLEQTQGLIAEISSTDLQSIATKTILGKGKAQGTYVCRELVIAYAAWISPAFHLKVIRVFLAQYQKPVEQLPLPAIDVKDLLLSGNSTPAIPLTPDVEAAINKKSFAMAGEAFFLIHEHLRRTVAHNCEYGQPRHLLVEKALDVIDQITLGEALAHEYFNALNSCKTYLWMAKNKANAAIKSIEDLHIATQANPLNGKGSQ